MALNIPGVIVMVLFYILILGTGVWAAQKSRKAERKTHGDRTEAVLLGSRNISLLIGIFTMTGTVVCGGQKVFLPICQFPQLIDLSLCLCMSKSVIKKILISISLSPKWHLHIASFFYLTVETCAEKWLKRLINFQNSWQIWQYSINRLWLLVSALALPC